MEIDYTEWKDPNSEARIAARQTSRVQRRRNWFAKMRMLEDIHAQIDAEAKPKESETN